MPLPLDSVATLEPVARWLPSPADVPRIALTTLPTPVERLPRLGQRAGVAALWIKRDDLSGRIYGGNKPRKLELLLAAARARGTRRILTFGGIGTHHGLAATACGNAAGLSTTLVLVPQPVTTHVQRTLLQLHALGADLRLARGPVDAARIGLGILARGALGGEPVTLVPAGGTSVLGALGYLNAGLELAEQVRAGVAPEPAAVFVALGSGGTTAGLLAGLRLGGLSSRVVGVRVSDVLRTSHGRLLGMARACLRRYAPEANVRLVSADLDLEFGYLGPGYGAVTTEGRAALQLLAETEGIELETTYTAKCLAALLDRARDPALRGRPLLFWNTFSAIEPALPGGILPPPGSLPVPFRRFFDAEATAWPRSGSR
jgi:D-cysteine desulfhydrase